MSIQITGNAPAAESQAYVDYLESKYSRKLKSLDINIDGDFADLNYEFEHVPFERIRRITGYLVGTMDPVSYTHLDVYKRQQYANNESCILILG